MSELRELGKLREKPEECEIGDGLGAEWCDRMNGFEMWAGVFVSVLYDPYDNNRTPGPYDDLMFSPVTLKVGQVGGELEEREVYQRVDPEEMEKLCV